MIGDAPASGRAASFSLSMGRARGAGASSPPILRWAAKRRPSDLAHASENDAVLPQAGAGKRFSCQPGIHRLKMTPDA
jgi:hypothetical protein